MTPLTYNWNVAGHGGALSRLERDISGQNLAHAYLFAGPDSVGKFTVAQTMAGILQCPENFCHTCHVCLEVMNGYHADTLTITGTEKTIAIEDIRVAIEKLHFARQGKQKILLIKNIERMTIPCSNAFLKTLEDPPEGTVFLLTSSRAYDVLPTIRSRVRTVSFGRLPDIDIMALLQEKYPLADQKVLKTVSAFSLGRPGKAFSLLNDPDLCESYRKMFEDIEQFLEKPDCAAQLRYVGQLTSDASEKGGRLITDFLEVFLVVLRQRMLDDTQGVKRERKEQLIQLAERTQEAFHLLRRNINSRLLLEDIMLSMS